jgi:hypothetical protein
MKSRYLKTSPPTKTNSGKCGIRRNANISFVMIRTLLCFLFLTVFSNIMRAQDTIFMKSGVIIPAIIQETGDVEIKYKKYSQPEQAGIYTVFINDVARLHYKDGRVVDPGRSGISAPGGGKSQSSDAPSSALTAKWSFGLSGNYFNRSESDNLLAFWRFQNSNNNLEIGGNPRYLAVNLSMSFCLGGNKRNFLGAQLQLIGTPKDAISASYNNGLNEIRLRNNCYNISMYYGRSINYKKNLVLIFEPSLDIGMMNGIIRLDSTAYKVSATAGMSSHFALGLDWNISKRISTNFRVGQRFMKIEEVHKSATSSTGYSKFYANPNISDELLYVKWSGVYVSLGFSYSLYSKMNQTKR